MLQELFFFLIFDVIFSIAKGVQHDGRLPFWKPASVFAHCVCIVIVFAIGEINILLPPRRVCVCVDGHKWASKNHTDD